MCAFPKRWRTINLPVQATEALRSELKIHSILCGILAHRGVDDYQKAKSFFRPESNILVKLRGNLVAAFKSDVKSLVVDNGDRAANLFRFSYPDNENNLCTNLEDCTENKTSLWNEIIVKPISIIDYKIVNKY
jgi:hypothetical protein